VHTEVVIFYSGYPNSRLPKGLERGPDREPVTDDGLGSEAWSPRTSTPSRLFVNPTTEGARRDISSLSVRKNPVRGAGIALPGRRIRVRSDTDVYACLVVTDD